VTAKTSVSDKPFMFIPSQVYGALRETDGKFYSARSRERNITVVALLRPAQPTSTVRVICKLSLIHSRPVIVWNVIAVLVNVLSVSAHAYFVRTERASAQR